MLPLFHFMLLTRSVSAIAEWLVLQKRSLSFWEMRERDQGLGPLAMGLLPSGKGNRTGLCTNSTRKAGVGASGTLQGVNVDMGMGVLRVRTCSNS